MKLFYTKEKMIRTLNSWDEKTFGEALSKIPVNDKNKESVALLKKVINSQGLANKRMNGNASESLKKKELKLEVPLTKSCWSFTIPFPWRIRE
jgi:hypothetical protein